MDGSFLRIFIDRRSCRFQLVWFFSFHMTSIDISTISIRLIHQSQANTASIEPLLLLFLISIFLSCFYSMLLVFAFIRYLVLCIHMRGVYLSHYQIIRWQSIKISESLITLRFGFEPSNVIDWVDWDQVVWKKVEKRIFLLRLHNKWKWNWRNSSPHLDLSAVLTRTLVESQMWWRREIGLAIFSISHNNKIIIIRKILISTPMEFMLWFISFVIQIQIYSRHRMDWLER